MHLGEEGMEGETGAREDVVREGRGGAMVCWKGGIEFVGKRRCSAREGRGSARVRRARRIRRAEGWIRRAVRLESKSCVGHGVC